MWNEHSTFYIYRKLSGFANLPLDFLLGGLFLAGPCLLDDHIVLIHIVVHVLPVHEAGTCME
jgi:hypothetical protein